MQTPSSRRTLFNYLGIAILMVGLGVGELIYWRGLHKDDPTSDADIVLNLESERLYERTMETNVGTFGLLVSQGVRALAKLKEPKPLAITVAVVSALAAGGCFWIAARLPREPDEETRSI